MNEPTIIQFILLSIFGSAFLFFILTTLVALFTFGIKRYLFTIRFFNKMKNVKAYDVERKATVTGTNLTFDQSSENYFSYYKDTIYHFAISRNGYFANMHTYSLIDNEWKQKSYVFTKIPELFISIAKLRYEKRIKNIKIEEVQHTDLNDKINGDYKSAFREDRLKKLLD